MTTAWTVKNNRYLRMNEDGSFFRVSEKLEPVDPTCIFEEHAKSLGWLTPLLGPGTFVYFKKDVTLVLQEVVELPFRIAMTVDKEHLKKAKSTVKDPKDLEVRYLPAFYGAGVEVDPPFMYRPPADMRLVFCGYLDVNKSYPYLLAQCRDTGSLYHPILPNVYDNGKLCVGAGAYDSLQANPYAANLGLDGFLTQMFRIWSETKWNSDLLGAGGCDPISWLKFDEKTRTNVIPDGKHWKSFSGGVIVPPIEICEALAALHAKQTEVSDAV